MYQAFAPAFGGRLRFDWRRRSHRSMETRAKNTKMNSRILPAGLSVMSVNHLLSASTFPPSARSPAIVVEARHRENRRELARCP